MQYLAAFRLITELKPKYTIKEIKSTVKDMTEIEQFPAKFMLEHNQQFLKCVAMLIDAAMDARHFTKNNKSAKKALSVH